MVSRAPLPFHQLQRLDDFETVSSSVGLTAQRSFLFLLRLSLPGDRWRDVPFTAMVASPSLEKRPVKMPNMQPLRLSVPPLHEQVKGFLFFLAKCTVLKVRFVINYEHQICCLQACMGELFSPETVQAGAVKGLN